MKTRFPLTATKRSQIGHAARTTRRSGSIPATLYGLGNAPVNLAVEKNAFISVYKRAGETQLVDLSIDGKTHPVLIHVIQKHPVTQLVSSVEFLMVNLTEKLKTSIPVSVDGVSPAVTEGKGTMLTILQEIEIEALPTNIPENISVNISGLTEVDQEIKVKELSAPSGVTILSDPELTVVKVGAIVVEAPAPVIAEPTVTAIGEAAETQTEPPSSEETTS